MFAQTCRGRRLDDPKKQTNLMFFRPVVCYECDFAPLRRLTAPPLPQGEALSEFIPQRRQEMNPRLQQKEYEHFLFVLLFTRLAMQGIVCYTF